MGIKQIFANKWMMTFMSQITQLEIYPFSDLHQKANDLEIG